MFMHIQQELVFGQFLGFRGIMGVDSRFVFKKMEGPLVLVLWNTLKN
jgi:hypothetical protein